MAALIRQPCGLAVLKRRTAHSVFLFFSIIKDSQGARAGMGSYAGADIVDDDICNPRKLGDKISRHAGVFRAVPVNNTYRHGFIGSVAQGIFHSFSKCADGFLSSPWRYRQTPGFRWFPHKGRASGSMRFPPRQRRRISVRLFLNGTNHPP